MNYKSHFILLLLLVFGISATAQDFRKQAPKPGPAPTIEIGDYTTFKLDNGMTGIVVENHKLPRVSFQLFLDLPQIAEGDKAGVANIAGDLLSKGTESRTKAEIDEAVDFIGASLGTSAGGAGAASLTKYKDQIVEILADVVLHPSFPEEEFEKLKKQTLSSLAEQKADPSAIASNVTQKLRYGAGHPYGELVTEETINNITLEDAKAFYDTYFQPSIAYFVVVGDITPKEAQAVAEKYFAGWKGKAVTEKEYAMPEKPAATEVDFVNKAGAVQSVINITYPIEFKRGQPDAAAVSVMNTILGSGDLSSRLNLNLREDKAYTYGASSQTATDEYVGYFNAGASVRNEVTDSAIVEFLHELERLRSEPVSDEELQKAKSILAGSFSRSLEQPQTVANFALYTVRDGLPEDYYATYLERLAKVSKEDVMAAAKRYIHPDRAHIVVVGNKGDVAEKLARFAAGGEVKYFDNYGEPVEMEEFTMPEDVTAEEVIKNYVAAIGGMDKIDALEDLTMTMSASVQGQNLQTVVKRKAPNMMSMDMTVSGMAFMVQKFDGEKGSAKQMGQEIPLDEASLMEMKTQAYIVPETHYADLGYKMELKGMEMVEGKKAYAVQLVSPSGSKSTDYYDISTGLKIRTVGEANGATVTNDFEDYREVEGVKFPYKLTVSGMMPFPLVMNVEKVEVNTGLEADSFKVE
jgi:predicted Zn-dependent peptidase